MPVVANDFDEMQLEIVEVGGSKVVLTLRAPGATPEKVGDKDRFWAEGGNIDLKKFCEILGSTAA
mgnify:CR=1 FL=1